MNIIEENSCLMITKNPYLTSSISASASISSFHSVNTLENHKNEVHKCNLRDQKPVLTSLTCVP